MGKTRSIVFRFLPFVSENFPLQLLIRLTGQKIIFPFYHLISDEKVPHINHLYKVRNTKEFASDLDLFLKHYKPLDLKELIESYHKDIPLKGNHFLLSFDDGLREFHDIIAPFLLRKGIPATCFLNSRFIDNRDLFYRYKVSLMIEWYENEASPIEKAKLEQWLSAQFGGGKKVPDVLKNIQYKDKKILDEIAALVGYNFGQYLEKQRPYLTSLQVQELIEQGFTFGAHSIDHSEYRFISEEEQIRQTNQSIDEICQRFHLDYRVFSFPFTDYGVQKSFFNTIFNPGSPVADLTFGGAGLKKDSIERNFQRIPFEGTLLTAKQILGTEYLYYMMKSMIGKNKIKR
ncbi:MAG: polysaccharide deacetylase family protein [Bacteroidetes bacterium]|nr:polysaccharide deacetylase family protein [Bacteroidota bacterium]